MAGGQKAEKATYTILVEAMNLFIQEPGMKGVYERLSVFAWELWLPKAWLTEFEPLGIGVAAEALTRTNRATHRH